MYQLGVHRCGPTRIAPARTAQGADHAQVVVVDNDHRGEGGAVKTDPHAAQRVPVLTRGHSLSSGCVGLRVEPPGDLPRPPQAFEAGDSLLNSNNPSPHSSSPPRFSKIYLPFFTLDAPRFSCTLRAAGSGGDEVRR